MGVRVIQTKRTVGLEPFILATPNSTKWDLPTVDSIWDRESVLDLLYNALK